MASIRTATAADLDAVVDLWTRAAGPTRHAGGVTEAISLLQRDPEALLLAVDADGVIAGSLIVGWDGWRAHLYRLAVDPTARRSGVAQALVEEAKRRARALGAVRVDAMVNLENGTAIAFWEAIGFGLEQHDGRFSLLL